MRSILNSRSVLFLIIALLIVIANGINGHFQPPQGITFTPVVLIVTTSCVCFGTKNLHVIIISILAYGFIALNDVLIKLYSGGIHDSEGQDWIVLYMLIGLIPSFLVLLAGIFSRTDEKLSNKLLAIGLFIGFSTVHFVEFGDIGLGGNY